MLVLPEATGFFIWSRDLTRVTWAANFGSFLEGKWDPGYFRDIQVGEI